MSRGSRTASFLGEAVSMLISADLADYSADERRYERLADASTSATVPVWSCAPRGLGPNGPGPGFRIRSEP